jgi:hypothetical protein
VLISTKTVEVHNENVRRSPQMHLLGCFHVLFAVRTSGIAKTQNIGERQRNSNASTHLHWLAPVSCSSST